jgi:geranylgeranyl pyrophosphate synthase
LSCAINFGAILNDTSNNDLSVLEVFSNKIGLAYQVQDDVLDVTTSDDILGKRQNSDSTKNKPSYPSIIGIDESIKIFKELYQDALDELSLLSVDAEPLRKITRELMSRSY